MLSTALVVSPADDSVRILTRSSAEVLTDRIRQHLGVARDLLLDAFRGQAWRALGYDSWDAYCRAEFAEARLLSLPPVTRRELVADLHEAGLSNRVIGSGLGITEHTVRMDIRKAARPLRLTAVTGADGRTYTTTPARALPALPAAPAQPAEQLTKVQQVLRDLDAAGARGLTSVELGVLHPDWRCPWAILSELHGTKGGRRVARLTEVRDGYAVYCSHDHVGARDVEEPGRRSRATR